VDHSIVEVFSGTGHCAMAIRTYELPHAEGAPLPRRMVRLLLLGGGRVGSSSLEDGGARRAQLDVYGMAAAYRNYPPPPSARKMDGSSISAQL
jgi:hypothetical protein